MQQMEMKLDNYHFDGAYCFPYRNKLLDDLQNLASRTRSIFPWIILMNIYHLIASIQNEAISDDDKLLCVLYKHCRKQLQMYAKFNQCNTIVYEGKELCNFLF